MIAFSFRAPYVVIISVPAGGYVITLTCPWDSPAETKHTDIVFNDQHVTRMRVTASLHKPQNNHHLCCPVFLYLLLTKIEAGEISKLCPKSASTNIANVPSVLNVRVIRAIHLGGYLCQKTFTQWQRLRLNSRERKRPCSPRCKQTFTLFSGPPK